MKRFAVHMFFGCAAVVCLSMIPGCPPGVDLCDGVTCDDGFTCNAVTGVCEAVDPCDGVTCADGESCVDGDCVLTEDPQEFTDADVARGGSLYDKWWAAAGVDAPTDDHAFWATRPDMDSNTRTGADTWRCKECHGWDYKGIDGAYATGSHVTGFAGIFGTTLGAQAAFDKIKTDHGLGDAGLSDADIWDLAKFALDGQIDVDDILADGAFTGSAEAGEALYGTACLGCHGADGLAIPPGAEADHEDFVGLVSNENPQEFQHKVRFGQPGTVMPGQVNLLTVDEINDLAAHAQTLPEAP